MGHGFFITMEGPDGSGKSTQLRLLAAWLAQHSGRALTVTRQPGGTAFGDQLRGLLLGVQTPLAPMAELALLFADRAQLIAEVVGPALGRGEVVLCDRWTDSTEAYQGGGRGVPTDLIHTLHAQLCAGLQPELTILLLPSLETSLARVRARHGRASPRPGADQDRFEREGEQFYRRVVERYEAIAAREPVRVVAIRGEATIEQVHALIVETVCRRLG